MTVSQSPQTYFGAVPPPGGPGSVWATRDHRTVESAYVMATTAALTSQVTEGAAATVDGTADVGLVIDGAIFAATTRNPRLCRAAGSTARGRRPGGCRSGSS